MHHAADPLTAEQFAYGLLKSHNDIRKHNPRRFLNMLNTRIASGYFNSFGGDYITASNEMVTILTEKATQFDAGGLDSVPLLHWSPTASQASQLHANAFAALAGGRTAHPCNNPHCDVAATPGRTGFAAHCNMCNNEMG